MHMFVFFLYALPSERGHGFYYISACSRWSNFFFFLCMTITSEKLASQADQASHEKWSVYKNDDSD